MKEIKIYLENHKIKNINTLRWLLKLYNIQIKSNRDLTAKNLYCPLCNEKMQAYWHTLNKGLVDALKKLYEAGGTAHLRDLDLTISQNNNFQKLHYFELAKSKGTGEYTIEDKGIDFLFGQIKIPKKVQTFRNKVIKRSEEVISVKDVHDEYEYPIDYSIRAEIVGSPKMNAQTELKI